MTGHDHSICTSVMEAVKAIASAEEAKAVSAGMAVDLDAILHGVLRAAGAIAGTIVRERGKDELAQFAGVAQVMEMLGRIVVAEIGKLCMISRDTWDTWVAAGFVPAPAVDRGQILRWHWPTVEAVLARTIQPPTVNPFMQGALNVGKARAEKARKEGRHRGVA